MRVNFLGKQLYDLDGQPIKGGLMNIYLSDALATIPRSQEDPQKLYDIAKAARKGEFECGNPDADLIRRVLRAHEGFLPVHKAQILDELDAQILQDKDREKKVFSIEP